MNDYLQFGSGFSAPIEWLNFDASPTLFYEKIPFLGKLFSKNNSRYPENIRYGDIIKGLPVPNNSCRAVYCSHVIEHLALDEMEAAILNVLRILEPGGLFRMVLPDLEYSIQRYCMDSSPQAAMTFMLETGMGRVKGQRSLQNFLISWLGRSHHLWMWDYKALVEKLVQVGFQNIRMARMGDSADPMFLLVEDPSRWENCLGIECQK
ncbi:MAG: methyltransferase domain-containing protein [Anaerolineaceae bacterium]